MVNFISEDHEAEFSLQTKIRKQNLANLNFA